MAVGSLSEGGRHTVESRWLRVESAATPPAVADLVLASQPCAGSRLLFLAEFLENGIRAQRVPERIEPKKSWRNGCWAIIPATVGRL